MGMEHERPKVGIGVLLLKEGKVLLGKRKGSHGAGEWALPGGYIEFGESFENTTRRELLEETGLTDIGDLSLASISNNQFEGKHIITICMSASLRSGEPETMEPEKCEGWRWFTLDELPEPLFEPSRKCIESLRSGKIYL